MIPFFLRMLKPKIDNVGWIKPIFGFAMLSNNITLDDGWYHRNTYIYVAVLKIGVDSYENVS